MLQCAVVDDEPLARDGIAGYVKEVDFLNLVGTCDHPLQLRKLLDEKPVDLIFLDIQMPKMSGIEFLKIVRNPPLVVLITAFPAYALEGFRLNVLDYLLKPVTFDQFLQSATKARDYHQLLMRPAAPETPKTAPDTTYFFIKCGSKFEKIHFDDILYIEGTQNYVTIYTRKGKFLTLLYLKNLEQQLSQKDFIRVHKSYIVSVDKIEGIEGQDIFIDTQRIPIGRNYKDEVFERVIVHKLWEKSNKPS